jgi:DNA-binding transcriptional ArsR family regulator
MANQMESLAVLGDSTRRAVLEQLRRGPLTVGEIADRLPVSRPAVSQHLRALETAGLVIERWEGTRHYFSINAATVLELRRYMDQMWQDAMQAFAQHVTTEESKHVRNKTTKSAKQAKRR